MARSRTSTPLISARSCSAWRSRSVSARQPSSVSTTSGRRWMSIATGGLTGKNLKLIRQVLTEGIWSEVVSLPNVLMRQARADEAHAPVKAAVTAQIAVAIAILSVAPVRLTNLVSIELEKNLIKPGGPNSPFWLVFPHYDVKNRVDLEFTFGEALTRLIEEYIHEFRPTLVRGSNAAWVFPGVAGKTKTANMFSTQIAERIQKATGSRIT